MTNEPKAYPYPQIVTKDDSWHVMETTEQDPQPRTDNLNRQMYVPMDRACEYCGINHSRMIRRHELGHAKWSPKTMGKLLRGTRSDAVEALEEVRINYLLTAKAKLDMDSWMLCKDKLDMDIQQLIYNGSIADAILYLLASYSVVAERYGHSDSPHFAHVKEKFRDAIDSELNNLSDLRKSELNYAMGIANKFQHDLLSHRYNQIPSYRKVQKLAEKLSFILNQFIDKPKPEDVIKPAPQPSSGGEGEEGKGEESTEGESEGQTTLEDTVSTLEKRMRGDLIEKMNYSSSTGIGKWGEMKIHNPPMTVNLQGRLKNSRNYRPMDYGVNPKYMNRWCVDKKVFKQKQNVKGGTILIDASGSMSFSGEDILEIMQLLPAVNIAMYNGSHLTGDLHIIAKNGMRVSEQYMDDHSGAGNVIDGPALEWLATMPARRIWVSDMYVFGAYGATDGYNLLKECYDLCTKHKIINLKDIDEVKEHALKLNVV
jgi:hypothetical protein